MGLWYAYEAQQARGSTVDLVQGKQCALTWIDAGKKLSGCILSVYKECCCAEILEIMINPPHSSLYSPFPRLLSSIILSNNHGPR